MMDSIDPKAHDYYCRKLFDLIGEISSLESTVTFDEVCQRHDEYTNVMAICQSPIEQMLGAALAFASDGYTTVRLGTTDYHEAHNLPLTHQATFGTRVFAQATVGKYRVDFMAVHTCDGDHAYTVIECDGHAFHERTKEQAARDKARDRFFAGQGMHVLRYTGSEIFRDVEACLADAEKVLCRQLESLFPANHHAQVAVGI